MESVVRFADIIGLSFMRTRKDVFSLQEHLTRRNAKHFGGVLKVETSRAFENLSQLMKRLS